MALGRLRLLLLEDRPDDAELIIAQLKRDGFDITSELVNTAEAYERALETSPDVILADYDLPQFGAVPALKILKKRGTDVPFIIVSGSIGEVAAAAAMRAGANDYVLKDNLSRLAPAIERERRAWEERTAARTAKEDHLERLSTIFDSAIDAVVTMDQEGRIIDWNPQAEATFGWSRAEAVGRLLEETVIPGRYREAHRRGLAGFLATGKGPLLGRRVEIEALHRSGHEFPVELSIAVARSGGRYVFSSFLRDITERRRAETALRESEERYRRIVETAFEGIWVIDAENRTTFVNPRMASMLGYTVDEVIGRSVLDFMDADAQATFATNASRRQAEPQAHHETRFRRKDGSELWTELEASPSRAEDGTYTGSLAMVTDVTQRRRAELALRESEERFRGLFYGVAAGQVLVAPDGRWLAVNPAFCQMVGYEESELLANGWQDIAHPGDQDLAIAPLTDLIAGKIGYFHLEKRYVRKNGKALWVLLSVSSVIGDDGRVKYLVNQVQDITARKQAEHELQEQTSLYEALIRAQSDLDQIIILTDGARPIYINEAFSRITGFSSDELMQKESLFDLVSSGEYKGLAPNLLERLQGQKAKAFATTITAKNGRIIELEGTDMQFEAGGRDLVFTLARDMTERNEARRALEYQAQHDALTGLPNRTLIHAQLGAALEDGQSRNHAVALLMLDVDHFKEVNDTFGHDAGDVLLRQIGPRLREVLPTGAVVARLGGDEFGIVLPETDEPGASAAAGRLLVALERPFEVHGQLLDIASSIGIAVYPRHGDTADGLLRCGDIALFVAKRSRGESVVYAPEYDRRGLSRLTLMAELRQGIAGGQLVLHYQPIIGLRDRRITGVEALVRWNHPVRGMVPPMEFIPFAEKTRLIQPLTQWALGAALRQCRSWHAGGHTIPVAVNISMRDLVDPGFPELVATTLRETQVEPSWLRLEITEGIIMSEPERAIETLGRLRKLGVRLAVDDFGTGYSSLAYLHRLPVHEIKIDKSFVSRVAGATSGASIVRASVELGHSLRLETVAEGVEDARTLDLVAALGCDSAQGFFISRPMPAAGLLSWLAEWERTQDRAA